jgi:hypothetical protein
MAFSQKILSRISAGLKSYQPILADAKKRDVSEADTSGIICDMLGDILGYDKYKDVAHEVGIRGTKVDLAVSADGDKRFLIEVKAAGIDLKDSHVKQAIDYGANDGIEWVLLTNGIVWRLYKIHFGKPIDKILVCAVDVLTDDRKSEETLEFFGNLSCEYFSKQCMADWLEQKQFTGKFVLAATILSEPMLRELRRMLRRLSSGLKIDVDVLRSVLTKDVIKLELTEGDEAENAAALVKKRMHALAHEDKKSDDESEKPAAIAKANPVLSAPPASKPAL